jgi:hypothetical protein
MSDKWTAKVISINGQPVAVVEVSISRTLMIDPETFQEIQGALAEGGLSEVATLVATLPQVPPGMRPYFVVPWMPADSRFINDELFARITDRFKKRAYWRVEGSAETGFTGILNIASTERRVSITEASLPEHRAQTDQLEQAINQLVASGELPPEAGARLKELCEAKRQSLIGCESAFKGLAAARAAKVEQERRRAEKEKREREIEVRDKGAVTGDFPRGFEDRFANMA